MNATGTSALRVFISAAATSGIDDVEVRMNRVESPLFDGGYSPALLAMPVPVGACHVQTKPVRQVFSLFAVIKRRDSTCDVNFGNCGGLLLLLKLAFAADLRELGVQFCSHEHRETCPI